MTIILFEMVKMLVNQMETDICGYERHLSVIFVRKKSVLSNLLSNLVKPDLRENPV